MTLFYFISFDLKSLLLLQAIVRFNNGAFYTILLSFILPLYFLLLYADSYTTDRNSGYLKCLIMRVGKKEYYKTKFKIAAIGSVCNNVFSLLLNFLLCIIFFHSGSSFEAWEEYYHDMNKWFYIWL